MARDAGFPESREFRNLEDFASELPGIMNMKGPVFVCLKVSHGDDVPEFRPGSTGAAMRSLAARLREA